MPPTLLNVGDIMFMNCLSVQSAHIWKALFPKVSEHDIL